MFFFNEYAFRDKHWKYVIRDRQLRYDTKVVNYHGVQMEVYEYEKSMRKLPDDDEIIADLKKCVMPFDIEIHDDEKVVIGNMLFDSLSERTKRYLNSVDRKFHQFDVVEAMKPNLTYKHGDMEDKLYKRYPDFDNMSEEQQEEMFIKHVMLGHSIPLEIERVIKMSYKRTFRIVKDLALSNCNDFKHFITLTFADIENKDKHVELNDKRNEGEYDLQFRYVEGGYDDRVKAFTDFMRELRKKLKKKYEIDIMYIAVPEEHANGEIHFHALVSELPQDILYQIPKWLDWDNTKNEFKNGYGLKEWKHGKSDVDDIRDSERVSTYISKYLLKNLECIDSVHYVNYLNRKRYYASRNLKKPIVEQIIDKKRRLEVRAKTNEAAYQSRYMNPYNNSEIVRFIINTNII